MARLAEEAGFKAVYMSGGSLGWYKCVTEANITLPEMAQVAVDMRAACKLPIVLDAGGGWGDPMHIQRTIALSEAAGFAAIEIEDQLLPRRVEHHRRHRASGADRVHGREGEGGGCRPHRSRFHHRRPHQFAAASHGLDEALRRGEAFKKAGADMVFVLHAQRRGDAHVGERAGPSADDVRAGRRVCRIPAQGARSSRRSAIASPRPPARAFAAMVKAVRQSYECLAQGKIDPFIGKGNVEKEMKAAMATTGLERLLEIERRTMKD